MDAKRTRQQGFIEANQELMNTYKDKELEAKDQELQRIQTQLALEIANKRRKDAEELLERYLIHPTTEASSSTQLSTLQGQIADLNMKLKVEEMQRVTLTTVFMAQEEKNKAEIERLNKALRAYEQEDRTTLDTSIQHYPSQEQMPITEEETMKDEDLEEGPAQEEEHLKVAEFQELEEELKAKISQEMDPVAKANME